MKNKTNLLHTNNKTRDTFPAAKIRKEGSKMYLLNGPDLILIILRFDDGRSPDQENDRRWFF